MKKERRKKKAKMPNLERIFFKLSSFNGSSNSVMIKDESALNLERKTKKKKKDEKEKRKRTKRKKKKMKIINPISILSVPHDEAGTNL